MKIAYDITLMQPGCALLQAALGCDVSLVDLFPTNTWLLHPTPNLRVYHIERSQLPLLVKRTREFLAKREEATSVA